MYNRALNCQVTVRYGVLYYRYWSAPVGCTSMTCSTLSYIAAAEILVIVSL